jgi:hypothetical protein
MYVNEAVQILSLPIIISRPLQNKIENAKQIIPREIALMHMIGCVK